MPVFIDLMFVCSSFAPFFQTQVYRKKGFPFTLHNILNYVLELQVPITVSRTVNNAVLHVCSHH